MSKLQAKFAKLMERVAKNNEEVSEYLGEVVQAQNMSGIVVMTLFQMLIEKGVMTKEEIEARVEKNRGVALDAEGGCQIPLTSLLDIPGGDNDEHSGG